MHPKAADGNETGQRSVSNDIELRVATDTDVDFLFSVYTSTRSEEMATFGWDRDQKHAFLKMQFVARSRSYKGVIPDATHYVVECAGTPVGQLIVDSTKDHLLLVDIELTADHRGRGIGRQIIEWLKNEAAEAGRPVILRVDKTNTLALAFYEKLGFVACRDTDILIEMQWESSLGL